jgi:hypothetical protein
MEICLKLTANFGRCIGNKRIKQMTQDQTNAVENLVRASARLDAATKEHEAALKDYLKAKQEVRNKVPLIPLADDE